MGSELQGSEPPQSSKATPSALAASNSLAAPESLAAPKSSAADRSEKGGSAGHIRKDFRPEEDPQFSCCIRLNLHRSVIVISSIMFPIYVLGTCYLIFTHSARGDRIGDDTAAAVLMAIAYGNLLFGSVFRIRPMYWVFAICSVFALGITISVMAEILEAACALLLGDLRRFPDEKEQDKNTSDGEFFLGYLLYMWFIISIHFYFFYIFWRDYNFITEYPRKKKMVTESEKLLKDE